MIKETSEGTVRVRSKIENATNLHTETTDVTCTYVI